MVVNGETLTPNQAARRDRVLDAAMSLAAEGGYDAVQMRDVASRAQVALGTIYRYFSSKDHVLAACQLELWRAMADRFGLSRRKVSQLFTNVTFESNGHLLTGKETGA